MDLQVLDFLIQSDVPTLLSRAQDKLNDHRDRRLRLFVVGRSKAGKSTLLNALVGTEILPVDVIPCSATLVEIGPGDSQCVITFLEAPDETIPIERLADYISEDRNPDNHKGVHQARIRHPSEHLDPRTLWYDTPGVDSIHPLHERVLLDNYHRADGVIVLYRALAGLSQHEIDLLRQMCDTAGQIILVQNDDALEGWEDASFDRILGATRTSLEEHGLSVAGLVRLDALSAVRGDGAAQKRLKELRGLIDQGLTSKAEALKRASLVRTLNSCVDQALSLHVTQREVYRRSLEEIDALLNRLNDLITASTARKEQLQGSADKVIAWLREQTDALVGNWHDEVGPELDAMTSDVTFTTDFKVLHDNIRSLLRQTLTRLCEQLDVIMRRDLGDLSGQLEQAAREEHESLERELELASLPQIPRAPESSDLYLSDIADDARLRNLLGQFAGVVLFLYDLLALGVQNAIRAIASRYIGSRASETIEMPLAFLFRYLRKILGTSLTDADVAKLRGQLRQRIAEHLLDQQQQLATALKRQLDESRKHAEDFIREQVGTQVAALRVRLVDVQQRRQDAAPDVAVGALDDLIELGRQVSATLDHHMPPSHG